MTLSWGEACPAPAKLNLFLHVVGRRADGYHLLQTVFRFIDRCDLLRFEPRGDGRIVRADPIPGVAEETDLTVRAAQALRQAAGERRGATIHLDKRLPMGGGLGGGSSDAATTLIALNRLWGIGFPRERLQDIGLALGADVPVFVYGRNAFAEGVGERLRPVDLPPAWYLVLEPPVAVATADIFRSPRLHRDTPPIAPETWRPGEGGNDLEAVACALAPEVARHLDLLRPYGRARMSGSGSCVFAEFPDQTGARAALAALAPTARGWVAAGLSAHPLRD